MFKDIITGRDVLNLKFSHEADLGLDEYIQNRSYSLLGRVMGNQLFYKFHRDFNTETMEPTKERFRNLFFPFSLDFCDFIIDSEGIKETIMRYGYNEYRLKYFRSQISNYEYLQEQRKCLYSSEAITLFIYSNLDIYPEFYDSRHGLKWESEWADKVRQTVGGWEFINSLKSAKPKHKFKPCLSFSNNARK